MRSATEQPDLVEAYLYETDTRHLFAGDVALCGYDDAANRARCSSLGHLCADCERTAKGAAQ